MVAPLGPLRISEPPAAEVTRLGRFVQKFGDQENSHAYETMHRVLAAVERSMALSVAGKRERFGPALILAIGKHVGERVNTLVSS